MFDEWILKYNLTKNYNKEGKVINKDIDYLLAHYYRTRLNTSVDLIMIIPTLIDDKKGIIIQDMYLNSKINWWNNMELFLPALDLIDAFINDIVTLSKGTRLSIVTEFKKFNKELKQITKIELIDYIDALLPSKPAIANQVKEIWSTINYSDL